MPALVQVMSMYTHNVSDNVPESGMVENLFVENNPKTPLVQVCHTHTAKKTLPNNYPRLRDQSKNCKN